MLLRVVLRIDNVDLETTNFGLELIIAFDWELIVPHYVDMSTLELRIGVRSACLILFGV